MAMQENPFSLSAAVGLEALVQKCGARDLRPGNVVMTSSAQCQWTWLAARRPSKPVEHDLYLGAWIVILMGAANALERENCPVQPCRDASQQGGSLAPAIDLSRLAAGAVRHHVAQQVAYFDLQISYYVLYDVSD